MKPTPAQWAVPLFIILFLLGAVTVSTLQATNINVIVPSTSNNAVYIGTPDCSGKQDSFTVNVGPNTIEDLEWAKNYYLGCKK